MNSCVLTVLALQALEACPDYLAAKREWEEETRRVRVLAERDGYKDGYKDGEKFAADTERAGGGPERRRVLAIIDQEVAFYEEPGRLPDNERKLIVGTLAALRRSVAQEPELDECDALRSYLHEP